MPDELVLADPWWDLRNPGELEQRQIEALTSELLRELSEGHPLHGEAFIVIPRSEARGDVLIKTGDHWILVHLTWSGRREPPPSPESHFFDSASEVEHAIALRG